MTRKIILDTETTGGSVRGGDRIIEIGMVETVDFIPTGRVYHAYMDPEFPIHWGATRVHKLTNKMLAGYPTFADHAQEISDFLGDAEIYAHNATFDRGFVTSELMRAGYEPPEHSAWTCTIPLARKALGNGNRGKASLDHVIHALGIKTPSRKVHGALLDAAILAKVVARISGTPDVDVEALVRQSKPFPGELGVPVPEGRGIGQKRPPLLSDRADLHPVSSAKDASSPISSAPGVLTRSANKTRPLENKEPIPSHILEDGLFFSKRIMQHALEAADLIDFVRRCEGDGLKIRPNISHNTRELNGFRFSSEKVQLLGSSVRLKGGTFRKGRLAYIPDVHHRVLLDRQKSYDAGHDRAHVPTLRYSDLKSGMAMTRGGRKAVSQYSNSESSTENRVQENILNDVDPFLDIRISDEVAANITHLNETLPSVRPTIYKDLKSGQDGWSKLSGEQLMQAAVSCADPASDAMRIISDLPERARDAALRWVCRGLDAGHALAKTASDAVYYDRPLEDEIMGRVDVFFEKDQDDFEMDMI